ncbi:MAG: MATE family efflux transporter [Ruminococcaceae bacterium]|nr:MATE family efflux transporter [Oscillospiraceae bacterium]
MLKSLRREPGFYRRLLALALPLILQNLITTALGFVDTFMVGLIGSNELSAVTAANTPIFLLQVTIFGLMSGLTVLVSQYWGQHDVESINRCMGVVMYLGLAMSSAAAAALLIFPTQVMGIVTDNPLLIELGAPYLRIVGVSYVFNAISSVYVSMQRSTENPIFGMLVFGSSMLVNTILNYILIFGKLGFPALGITGAAIATLISRILEFCIALVYALRNHRIPLLPKALLCPGFSVLRSTLKYSGPVMINEFMWGLGASTLTSIMGHMTISADMLAAHAIMGNIDKFSTVACFGLAGAASVLVGKRIGEGAGKEDVYQLGLCLLVVALLVGFFVSAALAILLPTVFIPVLYPLFQLSETATTAAITLCVVYLVSMPLRSFDITNIIGLMRAGGDTRMAAVLDIFPVWLFAIPLAALFGLVLDAPVFLVCAATQFESFIKAPAGIIRLRSRKWINNVTLRRD